jgi:hypothetical protein
VKKLILVLVSAVALCACNQKPSSRTGTEPNAPSAASKLHAEEAKVVQLIKD